MIPALTISTYSPNYEAGKKITEESINNKRVSHLQTNMS